MSITEPPVIPAGLKSGGTALWVDVTGKYDLEQHETRLLLEMARSADLLDDLAARVEAEGAMVAGRANPALIEARQLKIAFARLAAALRLPAGEEGEQQRRPQRRVGVRGVYGPRGVA